MGVVSTPKEHVCIKSLVQQFEPSFDQTWPDNNYASIIKITHPKTVKQRLYFGCECFLPGDSEVCQIYASGDYPPVPWVCNDETYPR